jgi:hypothetical protein
MVSGSLFTIPTDADTDAYEGEDIPDGGLGLILSKSFAYQTGLIYLVVLRRSTDKKIRQAHVTRFHVQCQSVV